MKTFISYSWDNEEHKTWVLKLADELTKNGVFVYLDRYDLSAGKNMTYFMENSVSDSDKVLIIMTPNYKVKSDLRKGGVGFEYSIIRHEMFEKQNDETKFIPILKGDNAVLSIPKYLKGFIYHQLNENFENDEKFSELLRIIFNKPVIERPKIGENPFPNNTPSLSKTVDFTSIIEGIKERNGNKELTFGLPSGFIEIDRITNGFQNKTLTLIASRPGMGKLSLIFSIIINLVFDFGKSVLIISNEYYSIYIGNRILSLITEISGSKLRDYNLNDAEKKVFNEKMEEVKDAHIYISEVVTVDSLEELVVTQKKKNNIDAVFIIDDYRLLHKDILFPQNTRVNNLDLKELNNISFRLKEIANSTGLPFFFEATLGESVEKRKYRKPTLFDLREIGIIQHEPIDYLLLLFRPEYYEIYEDLNGRPLNGLAEVIIAKSLHNLHRTAILKFNNDIAKFENLGESEIDFDYMDIDFDNLELSE